MVSANILRDRITLKSRILESDGAGGQIASYVDQGVRPAHINFISTSKDEQTSGGLITKQKYQITLRKSEDIYAADLCDHDGQLFEINTISPHPENNQFMVLECFYLVNARALS